MKAILTTLDSWLREQQIGRTVIYRTDGISWEEVDDVPEDAALLVRAEGLDWVQHLDQGIQQFNEEKPQEERVIVYTLGRRKDNIMYYCQPERRQELTDYLKTLTPPEPPEPPTPPKNPARRFCTTREYRAVA